MLASKSDANPPLPLNRPSFRNEKNLLLDLELPRREITSAKALFPLPFFQLLLQDHG